MKALRTPDERFANLPGYDFEAKYLDVPDGDGGQLRVHYVDEGPPDANPVLMMHGEPSWLYLYRKMIPGIVDAGHRAIAPDLIGFGRSDKPSEKSDYTFQRHVDNAVSKTINFPRDASADEIAQAYRLAWREGCKGITVYRDRSQPNQVLSRRESELDLG